MFYFFTLLFDKIGIVYKVFEHQSKQYWYKYKVNRGSVVVITVHFFVNTGFFIHNTFGSWSLKNSVPGIIPGLCVKINFIVCYNLSYHFLIDGSGYQKKGENLCPLSFRLS